MADFTFSCPHCEQHLEASSDMAGDTVECPTCKNAIHLAEDNSEETTPATLPPPPKHQHSRKAKTDGTGIQEPPIAANNLSQLADDPATPKQIAYIRDLGGAVPEDLTKEQASLLISELSANAPMIQTPTPKQMSLLKRLGATVPVTLTRLEASLMISELLENAPASQKKIKRLKELGASVPNSLTSEQASTAIRKLEDNAPPTPEQVKCITQCGGKIPKTTSEARGLCEVLPSKTPATLEQQERARWSGVLLPRDTSVAEADFLLDGYIGDDGDDDGENRKATQDQIHKITRLGGGTLPTITNWQADRYIEGLDELATRRREEFEERIENALLTFFFDAESRADMPVKKPSKVVMGRALKYGDEQGWGKNYDPNGWGNHWEDTSKGCDRMPYAILAIAPELEKKRKRNTGKGCLIPFALLLTSATFLVVLCLISFLAR